MKIIAKIDRVSKSANGSSGGLTTAGFKLIFASSKPDS